MDDIIINSWFGGCNERDWDAVASIYSDDALVHAKAGPLRGGQAVVELAKNWIESFPDAYVEPLLLSQERDVTVAHWRFEGTFEKPVKGIEATGEKVALYGHTCFRFKDQKVVEHWAAIDCRPLLEASRMKALATTAG